MLSHLISGDRHGNNGFTGVHHLSDPLPNYIEDYQLIEPENAQGIYVAKFALRRDGRKLTKEFPSTLFPKAWTKQQIYEECIFAIENKKPFEGSKTFYKSSTISGIPVEIFFGEDGVLRTLYPVRVPDNP